MLVAQERRLELEKSAASGQTARDEGTDMRRRIKRAQSLGEKALYGKASKDLAQSATFDPAAPGMFARMKALHPTPSANYPVSKISLVTCRPSPTSAPIPFARP